MSVRMIAPTNRCKDPKCEFIMDTDADQLQLPPNCATGSTALACNTGNKYIVNASGCWLLLGADNIHDVKAYNTLSAAITDINNGVTVNALSDPEAGKVKVYTAANGAQTVMLMDDVAESAQISINKNVTIVLAGNTLSFTDAAACLVFGTGTDCVIDGRAAGSAIYKNVAASGTINLIKTDGKKLVIYGGEYTLTGPTATALPFRPYSEEFEIYDAVVVCTTPATATNCRVFQTSTNAKIIGCTITAEGAKNPVALYVSGKDVTVKDCVISVSSTHESADAYGIRVTESAGIITADGNNITVTSAAAANGILKVTTETMYITNSDISATSTAPIDATIGSADGITNRAGTMYISESVIIADARGGHADQCMSVGISNGGTLFCKDTDVSATHSGIGNYGELYASGGTFKGCTHGGLYLSHGADGVAYIRDATLRCGDYTGQFADFWTGGNNNNYASMYVGGGTFDNAKNVTAYMDGCTFNDNYGSGDYQGAYHCIVMRGTAGETGHNINISNSKCTGHIRIDNETMLLNVGVGTNITESMIDNPQWAAFTNALYRKHHASEELTAMDYDAMAEYIRVMNN